MFDATAKAGRSLGLGSYLPQYNAEQQLYADKQMREGGNNPTTAMQRLLKLLMSEGGVSGGGGTPIPSVTYNNTFEGSTNTTSVNPSVNLPPMPQMPPMYGGGQQAPGGGGGGQDQGAPTAVWNPHIPNAPGDWSGTGTPLPGNTGYHDAGWYDGKGQTKQKPGAGNYWNPQTGGWSNI